MVFVGSGKLGIPENALLAMALGCDLINVGRTAMFAIGCIQAQRCHTGRCPTGVATQSAVAAAWARPGPQGGALRELSRHAALRAVAPGAGLRHVHPALVPLNAIELLDGDLGSAPAEELFDYEPEWGLPGPADVEAITALMGP